MPIHVPIHGLAATYSQRCRHLPRLVREGTAAQPGGSNMVLAALAGPGTQQCCAPPRSDDPAEASNSDQTGWVVATVRKRGPLPPSPGFWSAGISTTRNACGRRAEDLGGHMEALLLKPEEAAECLNIGRSKVYELMRAGALESVRIGALRRVPRKAVDACIEHLRKQTVGVSGRRTAAAMENAQWATDR